MTVQVGRGAVRVRTRRWIGALGLAACAIVAPATASAATFSNPSAISIPDSGSPAAASPYPSVISVADIPGNLSKLQPTVHTVSHGFPLDLDILLVAPNGAKTMLMSDTCGNASRPLNAATLTWDDAGNPMGDNIGSASCPTGMYRPTNNPDGGPDPLTAPAPPGPYTAAPLASFNGASPNGIWRLFVFDDFNPDGGSIAGGWSLDLLTDEQCSRKTATIMGTAAADQMVGTDGPDVMLGLGGNDNISGAKGKDVICGGAGNDVLKGGKGNDKLKGEAGRDALFGMGGGNDVCKGGGGKDSGLECEKEKSL